MAKKQLKAREVSFQELYGFMQAGETVIGNGMEFNPKFSKSLTKPGIDADKIFATTEHESIVTAEQHLMQFIFTGNPIFHVYDTRDVEDPKTNRIVEEAFKLPDSDILSLMEMSLQDIINWGPFLMQIGWKEWDSGGILKGHVTPAIKCLEPESFGKPPLGYSGPIYSEILRGIVRVNGNTEFHQTIVDGTTKKLNNVIMLKDRKSRGLAGRSWLIPLYPFTVLEAICMKSQGQKVNRIGAPIFFIRFIKEPIYIAGKRDDVAHAKLILENWGSNTPYILQSNMEPIFITFNDNQSAKETWEFVRKIIENRFNPTSFMGGDRNVIIDSGPGKMNPIKVSVQRYHTFLENLWRPIVQEFLNRNGYDGYRVDMKLPAPEPDMSQVNAQKAQIGITLGILTRDEARGFLDAPEMSDEIKATLEEERKSRAASTPGVFPAGGGPNEDGTPNGGRPIKKEPDAEA